MSYVQQYKTSVDRCEHGVEGFCMLCCREAEGKPTPLDKERPKTFEEATEDEDRS